MTEGPPQFLGKESDIGPPFVGPDGVQYEAGMTRAAVTHYLSLVHWSQEVWTKCRAR